MTTTITDIADLARILNEQPEWRDAVRSILLSQALIDLPQQIAESTQAANRRLDALETGPSRLETALAAFMEATNRRLDALEAGQVELQAGQVELQAGQARLETALAAFMEATNRRLDALEVGQVELQAGQVELQAGQTRLETALAEFMEATNRRLDALEAGQTRLETALAAFMESTNRRLDALEAGQARHDADIAEVKSGIAELRTDFGRLEQRVNRLEGTVGRLVGAELERSVHANIISIASRQLGLNRARILQSKIVARGPDLQDIIDDAEEQGVITADQGRHLELSDIIISGRRKSDRQHCYVVAEVSAGIRDADITRARDRAHTLAAAQQLPVIPMVVGASISHQQRSLADSAGVSVVIALSLVQDTEDDPPADE